MKKLLIFLPIAVVLSTGLAGCLLQPENSYTYWRYSDETKLYSPFRSEFSLTPHELKMLGLISTLPADAKTSE